MKTLIIAEAGVNHNGSIELAKRLIEVAAESGADIVKFQTFTAVNLASRRAKKADYQKANMHTDTDETQFEMLKRLELSKSDHNVLIEHCKRCSIEFWSTAFDVESVQLLRDIGIKRWKIPSGEITNLPYLQRIGSFKEEIILSTGMCTLEEIQEALDVITSAGTRLDKITLLHCNTEYPTPMEDVNLTAMLSLKKRFLTSVGYSDHTKGIEVPVAAVALGAEVVEKHFTLDRNMSGPDHRASLEPDELRAMITSIRNIEIALGDGLKRPTSSELKNIAIARKSIHLASSKQSGEFICMEDLVMKRPGDGISPMKLKEVLGKRLNKDLQGDSKLDFDDLET